MQKFRKKRSESLFFHSLKMASHFVLPGHMRIRRAYITLLELLIVIAILGFIAGIIGINATKAWQEHRFRAEVSKIVDQLRLAQDLMLIFNTSVQVKFPYDPETGIDVKFQFDTPLPQRWSAELNRPHDKLTFVRAISFDDKIESEDKLFLNNSSDVSAKFLSGGSRVSRGTMRISTSNEENPYALTRYISFSGIPGPIVTVSTLPPDVVNGGFGIDFERNLTTGTASEIKNN